MAGAAANEERNIYLRFHDNHGTRVRLGPQNIGALRISEQPFNGIVMSDQTMEAGFLYQVLITEVHHYYPGISLGVVNRPPETFNPLPQHFGVLDMHVLCVEPYAKWEFGRALPQVTPTLYKTPVGSKLGLSLDFSRNLHLYLDEEDKGIVCFRVPYPCWFMLDLTGYMKAVACLPVQCLMCKHIDLTPYPSSYYPSEVYEEYQ